METSTKPDPRPSGAIRTLVMALALATAFSGISLTTAQADDHHDHHDHDRHEHHDRHWHGGGGYVYTNPGAYYAPPPTVYYAPPPPPPGINFVFPLHIR